MRTRYAFLFLAVVVPGIGLAGQFSGNLVLLPEGCQTTDARICRLGEELTYHSSRDNLVWQTDTWTDDNLESGTTDGASIPRWAQSIIGDPYDESYLKAAIIHDHYCYKENRVRTWQQTHRMFYDALVDLGVDNTKAKIMYAAVYMGGPRWRRTVSGEDCGNNCIKQVGVPDYHWQGDRYTDPEFQEDLNEIRQRIMDGSDMSLEEIESAAHEIQAGGLFHHPIPEGEANPDTRSTR